jgi:hypothetical protein
MPPDEEELKKIMEKIDKTPGKDFLPVLAQHMKDGDIEEELKETYYFIARFEKKAKMPDGRLKPLDKIKISISAMQ